MTVFCSACGLAVHSMERVDTLNFVWWICTNPVCRRVIRLRWDRDCVLIGLMSGEIPDPFKEGVNYVQACREFAERCCR